MSGIVVVGGSGGIGQTLVDALDGVAWSRRTGVDATDEDALQAAIARHVQARGAPDAVIHCVGSFATGPILSTDTATFDELVRSNLRSAFLVARAVLPPMIEAGGGRVIFFSAARVGQANVSPPANAYYAAKAGVVELAKALAVEAAGAGVTVNVIAPGVIHHHASHRESQDQIERTIPLRRAGTPEDILHAVRFLLSPDADYVTGTVIPVDGALGIMRQGTARPEETP